MEYKFAYIIFLGLDCCDRPSHGVLLQVVHNSRDLGNLRHINHASFATISFHLPQAWLRRRGCADRRKLSEWMWWWKARSILGHSFPDATRRGLTGLTSATSLEVSHPSIEFDQRSRDHHLGLMASWRPVLNLPSLPTNGSTLWHGPALLGRPAAPVAECHEVTIRRPTMERYK